MKRNLKATGCVVAILVLLLGLGIWQKEEGIFSFSNGTIYGYQGEMLSVTVPQEVDGEKVRTIATGTFWENPQVEAVILPDSLVNLWEYSFYGCENLREITLSSDLNTIGASAFEGTGLQSITLGRSLSYLGQGAFARCLRLTEIVTHPENPKFLSIDGVLFSADATTLIQYPLGNALETYLIPDTVSTLGATAFSQVETLRHLVIPNSVKEIPGGIFAQSPALTIYAKGGSYAEAYALAEGLTFQEMDGEQTVPLELGRLYEGYQVKIPHVDENTTIRVGELPTGLGLYPNGVIYGVPQEVGTFVFAVNSTVGEVSYTITILEEEIYGSVAEITRENTVIPLEHKK